MSTRTTFQLRPLSWHIPCVRTYALRELRALGLKGRRAPHLPFGMRIRGWKFREKQRVYPYAMETDFRFFRPKTIRRDPEHLGYYCECIRLSNGTIERAIGD
jgi:hypothetical protein